MTFKVATSDLKGRDFKRVEDSKSEFFWEGDGDNKGLMERFGGGVRVPLFTWRDYFETEFEFVVDEVIEVGDVVEKCEDRECEVINGVGKYFALHCPKPHCNPVCACTAFLSVLTLIHKGAVVHTFEGARDIDFNCDGKQEFRSGPITITLKEEVSDG